MVKFTKSVFGWFEGIFFEPIFFAFALFIIFEHVQHIINQADYATLGGWWEVLKMDIAQSPYIYVVFGLLFLWWVYYKVRCLRGEKRRDEAIKQAVKDGIKEAITELKEEGIL